jgi:hypothetical protein
MGLLVSRASNLSEKMLQVSAVVPATPHVSTHFWGTSAELAAAFHQRHRARYGGPCDVVTERRPSAMRSERR